MGNGASRKKEEKKAFIELLKIYGGPILNSDTTEVEVDSAWELICMKMRNRGYKWEKRKIRARWENKKIPQRAAGYRQRYGTRDTTTPYTPYHNIFTDNDSLLFLNTINYSDPICNIFTSVCDSGYTVNSSSYWCTTNAANGGNFNSGDGTCDTVTGSSITYDSAGDGCDSSGGCCDSSGGGCDSSGGGCDSSGGGCDSGGCDSGGGSYD